MAPYTDPVRLNPLRGNALLEGLLWLKVGNPLQAAIFCGCFELPFLQVTIFVRQIYSWAL